MIIIISIGVLLGLAYFRASLWLWSVVLIIAVGAIGYDLCVPNGAFLGLVGATTALALVLNLRSLRLNMLTRPLFGLFQRMLPALSDTEREALEAGTVGWDGELFSGDPDWQKLLNLPKPALSDAEQAFLDGPVEDLCRMLDDWQMVEFDKDLPPQVWQFLKEQRFFGMIIPPEYGGLGFSALGHSAVIMKIASRSITAAVTAMVPNSLGPAELLLHYEH